MTINAETFTMVGGKFVLEETRVFSVGDDSSQAIGFFGLCENLLCWGTSTFYEVCDLSCGAKAQWHLPQDVEQSMYGVYALMGNRVVVHIHRVGAIEEFKLFEFADGALSQVQLPEIPEHAAQINQWCGTFIVECLSPSADAFDRHIYDLEANEFRLIAESMPDLILVRQIQSDSLTHINNQFVESNGTPVGFKKGNGVRTHGSFLFVRDGLPVQASQYKLEEVEAPQGHAIDGFQCYIPVRVHSALAGMIMIDVALEDV